MAVLGAGVRAFVTRLTDRLGTDLGRLAQQARVDLPADAPWTDRSGDARASLDATVEREDAGSRTRFTMTLGYHGEPGAPHGVFLERANAGNYAVVDPEAERMVPRVRRLAQWAGAAAR